jgi:glc operon protein GlcG
VIIQEMLGLRDANVAIAAGIREAEKDARPMAFAVADAHGELIACYRMDGAHPRLLRHAIRKAYTSGIMHRGTLEFKAQLAERDSDLDDWGDARLTTLQGGLAVRHNGAVIGAVSVGGNEPARDIEICEIVLAAIGAALC